MSRTPRLVAPSEFWSLTDQEKTEIVNGCGLGGVTRHLIPDHLMGVDIREACAIHDYEYHFAKSGADYSKADEVFHRNMLKLIADSKARGPRKWLAQAAAYFYYLVVKSYSGIFK